MSVPANFSNVTAEASASSGTLAMASIIGVTAFFAFLFNLLTIIAFIQDRRCRTAFNIYLLNLAITDLIVSVFDMPFVIGYTITGQWPFGSRACSFYLYVDYIFICGTINSVMLISLDRWFACFLPVSYHQFHSVKLSCFASVVMWVVLHVLLGPYIVTDRMMAGTALTCFVDGERQNAYSLFIMIALYWFPIALISLCYFCIWWNVRTWLKKRVHPGGVASRTVSSAGPRVAPVEGKVSSPEKRLSFRKGETQASHAKLGNRLPPRSEKAERRFYIALSWLTLCIVIGWIPVEIYYTLLAVSSSYDNFFIYAVVVCIQYFTCVINPLVYDFSVPEIRVAVRNILHCRS